MWIDPVTYHTPGLGGTQEEWEAFDEGHRLHLNIQHWGHRFDGTAFPILTLPAQLLPRVLAGIPLADHRATAAACRAFRAVITDPQFPAVRRGHGLRERGIVVVQNEFFTEPPIEIRLASNRAVVASIPDVRPGETTTDGARLIFSAFPPPAAANNYSPREDVFVVEASSPNPYAPIQWRQFATLPQNQQFMRSIEWHDGCLYVFGGCNDGAGHDTEDPGGPGTLFFDSLHVFREATGLWEQLPPMPHACIFATSGIIGDCLYVAGGFIGHTPGNPGASDLSTLQIYDIASRTWRLGAPMDPRFRANYGGHGGLRVLDGKLFVIGMKALLFYDPQSNVWTVEQTELPWHDDMAEFSPRVVSAFPHQGRIVVFLSNDTAFERDTDGSWSRYKVAKGSGFWYDMGGAASVLLG